MDKEKLDAEFAEYAPEELEYIHETQQDPYAAEELAYMLEVAEAKRQAIREKASKSSNQAHTDGEETKAEEEWSQRAQTEKPSRLETAKNVFYIVLFIIPIAWILTMLVTCATGLDTSTMEYGQAMLAIDLHYWPQIIMSGLFALEMLGFIFYVLFVRDGGEGYKSVYRIARGRCPICNSNYVVKIGSEHECKSCGHRW